MSNQAGEKSKQKASSGVVENTTSNREEKGQNGENVAVIEWSFRSVKEAMHIYCDNHRDGVAGFVEEVVNKAPTDPKWAEIFVKLYGGYDKQQVEVQKVEIKPILPDVEE